MRRVCVDQIYVLDCDADARYIPLADNASAVTEPDAFLSENVEDFVQSLRETVMISSDMSLSAKSATNKTATTNHALSSQRRNIRQTCAKPRGSRN
jgi:hypothetical protein